MSVIYHKAPVRIVEEACEEARPLPRVEVPFSSTKARPSFISHRFLRILPAVMVTLGSVLIANVAWPIISYQLFVSPTLQAQTLITPITPSKSAQNIQNVQQEPTLAAPVSPVRAAEETRALKEPKIITEDLDYTNLSEWFPTQEIPEIRPEEAKTYSIDIPTLNVYDAEVKVGGLNLEKNLIQYPGTANPGELGSPVVFGHSVSPLFYNPSKTNSRRYISMFTKIMDLKKDDKIIVRYDGITYTYRVTNKMEVKPDDTYILEQRYDVRELKLVTCTPAGTTLRRGIVFAQLEDMQ